ncbi:MAG: aminoacyl-histidine dipeptidase [Bacteroidota bacterium]|nr:aminoacyl-histidine dipeptidase [Bacteroidota bacterium]
MTIEELQPQEVFHYFKEICQIPRPSKKEAEISAYLCRFAEKHGLDYKTDAAGNVLIRKNASKGYENRPSIILQSHMDMVCEKNSSVVHDFEKDAIETYVEDGWLKAKGTTLGADNGIGMAAQLAVLASDVIEHGALECLFTVDEETGLTGAFALQKGFLSGSTLINLDSEDDGEIFIGCAGGIDTTAVFTYTEQPSPKGFAAFSLKVSGLVGGHSGDDIDKGRGNANKILVRFLWSLMQKMEVKLAKIDGGNLRNAIPREAEALFLAPMGKKEEVRIAMNHYINDIEEELRITEPNVSLDLSSAELPTKCVDDTSTWKLLNALYACPHGVIRMSDDMKGLVETSTNLASVKMLTDNKIIVGTSQRSSIESSKYDIANMVNSVFSLAGAEVKHGDGYPGWKPNPNSKIANAIADNYRQLFGEEPKIKAIHAGLECGLFSEKYPGMDMASIGPTMRGVHSPDERLDIAATQKFWQLLLATLKNFE